MNEPSEIMTVDDLAAYLKIPKSTLYKLVREGQIPSQKVGRHWRFRKQTIDRWLDRGESDVFPDDTTGGVETRAT